MFSYGDFNISGFEIIGDFPQAMLDSQIAKPGRKINLLLAYEQNQADLSAQLWLKSPDLLDVNTHIDFVLEDLDPDMAEQGPEALAMIPVSLRRFSTSIKDHTLGAIIGNEMGIDPYMMMQPLLLGITDPEKADSITKWLEQARVDGAFFKAHPDKPMPLPELMAGVNGDWSALAAMLKASTTP